MKRKRVFNVTLLNTICGLILQLTTIICGFIIPKIILSTFGSETNGIISSISQFFGYASLIEGGLTGVVMAKLYKPIVNKNCNQVSKILNTTESFYHKLSIFFIFYSLVLAIIYPLLFKSSFSYGYVSSLVIILGIGLLIQYNFSLAKRTVLQANKKGYIVSLTQTFILIINVLLNIIVVKFFPSVHIMKLITGLLFFVQPLVYSRFLYKDFKLSKNNGTDNTLIKSRWDGFAISLAAFIHNNTDIIVLTIFSTFKNVSIYSVYALVIKGITSLIKSVSNAISPTIGQEYAKKSQDFNKKMELYEFIIFFICFFAFGVTLLLITPFVMLYTKGITDANYNQPIFGFVIVIAELFSCIREPYLNIAFSANEFKKMKKPSFIEAILNIIISVILVSKYGLIGIAFGTLIAMIFRTVYQIHFLEKNVIYKKASFFYKKVFLFSITSTIAILICKFVLSINITGIFSWIIAAVIYSVIILLLLSIMSIVFFKDNCNLVKYYIERKKD